MYLHTLRDSAALCTITQTDKTTTILQSRLQESIAYSHNVEPHPFLVAKRCSPANDHNPTREGVHFNQKRVGAATKTHQLCKGEVGKTDSKRSRGSKRSWEGVRSLCNKKRIVSTTRKLPLFSSPSTVHHQVRRADDPMKFH